jgi:hypothetical protein
MRSAPRSTRKVIRGLALAAFVLTACKGRQRDSPQQDPPPPHAAAAADAAIAPDANLDACRAAAARVPTLAPAERAKALLDACRPCGDWEPLLAWNTPPSEGGPPRSAIEHAMFACNAFCDANAKQRFFGTLDNARGQPTRTPWRLLGEICKAEVSAVPDARFMGAPYFALDRIARAIGDPGLLAAIELPLPAVTITGVGVDLPRTLLATPAPGPAITVDAGQFLLGSLPIATPSPTGLQVAADYPGTLIEPRALAAALARPALAGRPVAVLAPYALDAARIADLVGAAGGHDLRLAVAAGGLPGWNVPGTLPIMLVAKPAAGGVHLVLAASAGDPRDAGAMNAASAAMTAAGATPADLARGPVTITIESGAKVGGLARLLAALTAHEVKAVTLVNSPAKPPAAKP